MWGEGGRLYWKGKVEGGRKAAGIVVVFAWMSSQESHLLPFVDLYSSLGWTSLVCHADFLTFFFPEKSTSLAYGVILELIKEVKMRPTPIVFATFSGGTKVCMYKVLQLLDGKCEGQLSLDEYQLVRDCVCGQIYDSSPVDFTSDLVTWSALHPSVPKKSQPPRVVSWIAKALASGLDTFFPSRFEAEGAEYWETLYSSASVGPFLIFCSRDDELAPYPVICSFAQRLQELGRDVRLIKWNAPHVGHYEHHSTEYKAAVTELLSKAAVIYYQRRQQTQGGNEIPESVCSLHTAAVSSNESLRRVGVSPSDHFFLPSSMEYHENKDTNSSQDERKGFHMRSQPSIDPHGVLGQILYDVCVPKNIEGWDIKPVASSRRHGPSLPIRFMRRSKL